MASHLKALLRKNWILWKRNLFCSILEILVPVLFCLILLGLRAGSPLEDIPETSYVDDAYPFSPQDFTFIKNCSEAAEENNGRIALVAPAGETVDGNALMSDIKSQLQDLGLQIMEFDGNDEVDEYVKASDYALDDKRLCFGITFHAIDDNGVYDYDLRFNETRQPGTEDVPPSELDRTVKFTVQEIEEFEKYTQKGFMEIQNFVDTAILRHKTGVNNAAINTFATSVKLPAYKKDDLTSVLKGNMQTLIGLPMLLPYLRFITAMLREKEKRIREGMKMMGLNNGAFYLSWLITYFIILTITSLLVSIVLAGAFFTNSSWGLLFTWHWTFSLAILGLGFLCQVFFSKAKSGTVFGFVIFFLLGFLEVPSGGEDDPVAAKFICSFGPPTSIALSGNQILNFESDQTGLNQDNVNLRLSNYEFWFHYFWMCIDFLLFNVLAVYLDQVLPQEFGVRKHPLFCLKRNKDKKTSSKVDNDDPESKLIDERANPDNFEETDPAFIAQDKNNESIKVQKLKKQFASGKVAVDGVSFNMYKGQIFALLGHNGAGKTTTINMITGLYEATSGQTSIFGTITKDNLEEVRKQMGVCPQHDILFDNLTVKEHLELFATFKGMEKEKMDKDIKEIISDLDLADKTNYLAKNLSGGQKRKLSVGIAFIGGSKFILLDEPSSGMDTSARRRLWDMLKNYRSQKVILLTTHYMDEADYLGDRIAIMGEGQLQCLGGPMFLKSRFGVGYTVTFDKKENSTPSNPITEIVKKHIPEAKLSSDVSKELQMQLPQDTAPKFKGMFEEIDEKLSSLEVRSYGVSMTTLEEVFLNVSNITVGDNKKGAEAARTGKEADDLDLFDLSKEKITNKTQLFKEHFQALVLKRYHYSRRDKKGLFCEIFLPVIMIIVGLALTKIQIIQDPVPLEVDDQFWGHVNNVAYNAELPDGTNVPQALINPWEDDDDFEPAEKDTNDLEEFDDILLDEREEIDPYRKFSVFFTEIDNGAHQYSYYSFADTRALDSGPVGVNYVNDLIFKYATGNQDAQIRMTFRGFSATEGLKEIENFLDGFSISFVFSIGMSFIPASLVTFIVKEREHNIKHQQIVSGVSLGAYWISNYFIDVIKTLIPGILSSLMALVFDASGLIDGEKYGVLWSLFLLYAPSITAFVYLTSFLFKDYGTAQTATFFFNFGTGFIGGLAVAVLRLIKSTNSVAKGLHWILRILPTFSLTYGFLNLSNQTIYARVEEYFVVKGPWDLDIAGADVLYLALTAVIYFMFVFVVEALRNKKSLSDLINKDVPYLEKEIDDDVEEEQHLVETSKDNEFPIKVNKLRKVFRVNKKESKVAVDRVSLGIREGDCFALLGVNGAGKTTTFKMLSGEINPTQGQAYIKNYKIPNQMNDARQYIGYCPQFDALLENLTAKEHLQLYAAIKGIPVEKRPALVQKQLRDLNLTAFENIPAGTYSGGNKRKLSVAIALIGNPPIIFLDEPSNGMDPEARRFMWNVISRLSTVRKQSSIILTTHSMEEAEALSNRIGIMVDGGLKCLGSAQHIKNKYGGGFEIEIKLELPKKDQIREAVSKTGFSVGQGVKKEQISKIISDLGIDKSIEDEIKEGKSGSAIYFELQKKTVQIEMLVEWIFIEKLGMRLNKFLKESFNQTTLIEHFSSFYRFKINTNMSIGKVFGLFEGHKSEYDIIQYSVKQTSIEQIFNLFANNSIQIKTKNSNNKKDATVDITENSNHANQGGQQESDKNQVNSDDGSGNNKPKEVEIDIKKSSDEE